MAKGTGGSHGPGAEKLIGPWSQQWIQGGSGPRRGIYTISQTACIFLNSQHDKIQGKAEELLQIGGN